MPHICVKGRYPTQQYITTHLMLHPFIFNPSFFFFHSPWFISGSSFFSSFLSSLFSCLLISIFRTHGDAPEVTIHGRTDLHFPYAPSHIRWSTASIFDLIWSYLIWSYLIWSYLIWFDLIWFDLIWFDLTQIVFHSIYIFSICVHRCHRRFPYMMHFYKKIPLDYLCVPSLFSNSIFPVSPTCF